jgi:tRNA A37 threonylcarbamoyltransferase TsaD
LGNTSFLVGDQSVACISCAVFQGTTKDDAIGECFDKVARMLHLSVDDSICGGRAIEEAAKKSAHPSQYKLPVGMSQRHRDCDFSFSGLKSAVQRLVANHAGPLDDATKNSIACAFQLSIISQIKVFTVHVRTDDLVSNTPGSPSGRVQIVSNEIIVDRTRRR